MYNKPATEHFFDAKYLFQKNYSGKPTTFNPNGGVREITIVIPTFEQAEDLYQKGWPIMLYHRQKEVRDAMKAAGCRTLDDRIAYVKERNEFNEEFITFYLKVKISFKKKIPTIIMHMPLAGNWQQLIDESVVVIDNNGQKNPYILDPNRIAHIDILDNVNIIKTDLEVELSWHPLPQPGYTAYVKELHATIEESPFVNMYTDCYIPREDDGDDME
jgi:hypothetical protein